MAKSTHTKNGKLPANVWKKRSNKLKDLHRDYEKVHYLEGGKLVSKWTKKIK